MLVAQALRNHEEYVDTFYQMDLFIPKAALIWGHKDQEYREEVASIITCIASKEISFKTGATFDISGGRATFW